MGKDDQKHILNIIRYATVVPKSRDQNKKMATRFYTPQNTEHTQKYVLFKKSRLKSTYNTINNITLSSVK